MTKIWKLSTSPVEKGQKWPGGRSQVQFRPLFLGGFRVITQLKKFMNLHESSWNMMKNCPNNSWNFMKIHECSWKWLMLKWHKFMKIPHCGSKWLNVHEPPAWVSHSKLVALSGHDAIDKINYISCFESRYSEICNSQPFMPYSHLNHPRIQNKQEFCGWHEMQNSVPQFTRGLLTKWQYLLTYEEWKPIDRNIMKMVTPLYDVTCI